MRSGSRLTGSGSRPIRGGAIGDESSESPDTSPSRLSLTGRNPSTSPSRENLRLPPWLRPTSLKGSESCTSESAPEKKAATMGTSRAKSASTSAPAAGETPTASTSARRKRRATKSRASELDPSLPHPQPQPPETDPGMSQEGEQGRRNSKRKKNAEGASQEEGQGSDSSEYSSPLREPQPPLVPIWTASDGRLLYGFTRDQAVVDAYYRDFGKYQKKQARQERLLTLKPSLKVSSNTECYSPKQRTIFLHAAKSVLSLSAYHDGKEINQCTGIVFERDEVKNSTIILTSAWIMCTNKPFDDWSDKDYAPEAKVIVHLLDGTTSEGQLLYFSKHYDVAFFEIMGGSHLQILPLEPNLEFGQDVYVLTRDKELDLICRRAMVKSLNPCEHQHNHYLFINGSIPKRGTGGALADFNGKIVGMIFCTLPRVAFIPSSLILKCSTLLRKFGRLARPQLGLKLTTVGFLDISRVELLSRKFSIASGLIVGEVSAKCVAERLGIRVGDVILSCQGESVSSITQLEDILLGVGEKHLEKSNDLSSKVDVEVGVYHVRKYKRRAITLTVELSDGIEVFHSV